MKVKGKASEINQCPECGSDTYYVNISYSGTGMCCYFFDESRHDDPDNTGLHDGVIYKEQKTAYCTDCHSKIGVRIDEISDTGPKV